VRAEPEGKSEAGRRNLSNRLAQLSPTEARLPKPLTEATSITFARDPATDGLCIGLVHDFARSEKGVRWFHFDQDGHVLEQQQFEDDSQVLTSDPIPAAAFVPPGVWAVGTLIAVIESRKGIGLQRLWLEVKRKPAEAVRAFSLAAIQPLLGIVLAICAARRRRLAKRQTCWWGLWAFFFGPCGGLALLAVYPQVQRQPCPNCRQATRVDWESCERCGHSLDDLPATGIELFDRDLPVGREVATPPAPCSESTR
jgi:hypothetical protein